MKFMKRKKGRCEPGPPASLRVPDAAQPLLRQWPIKLRRERVPLGRAQRGPAARCAFAEPA